MTTPETPARALSDRMVRFSIPGQPQGKGRPIAGMKFVKGGGKVASLRTPAKTVAYEGLVAHAAQVAMAGRPLIEGPVDVRLFIGVQVPASWSLKKQRQALAGEILPTTKPDKDNVIKAVYDGCNGVIWRDDVQVVDGRQVKRYAAVPRVDVQVIPFVPLVSQAALLPDEQPEEEGAF